MKCGSPGIGHTVCVLRFLQIQLIHFLVLNGFAAVQFWIKKLEALIDDLTGRYFGDVDFGHPETRGNTWSGNAALPARTRMVAWRSASRWRNFSLNDQLAKNEPFALINLSIGTGWMHLHRQPLTWRVKLTCIKFRVDSPAPAFTGLGNFLVVYSIFSSKEIFFFLKFLSNIAIMSLNMLLKYSSFLF